MLRKLLLSAALAVTSSQLYAAYIPVPLTGFTADIVANGFGSSATSTNADVDNGGYVFMAPNFNPAGLLPTTYLPLNGLINSQSTSGLTFQLASYSANNSLRIGNGLDSLVLVTPQAAGAVHILATSGIGSSTANVTINFTDGTSQTFPTTTIDDWNNGTNPAISGVGRVLTSTNSIENNSTNPRIYEYGYALTAANHTKLIRSLVVERLGGGVVHVMAATLNTSCNGTPTAGSTVANLSYACPGASLTLSLSGNSVGVGQIYQFQSSTTVAGTYTNIGTAGASPTYSGTVAASLWYRAAITCGTSTSYSTPVQVIMSASLPAGTYTINPAVPSGATNFQSFGSAVAAMTCGIAGAVTFNMTAGAPVYYEQVTIPAIPGASGLNTVTFNGNGNTLSYNATLAASPHTLTLNGTDYFTFNNLNIIGTGSEFALVCHLWNQADSNRFNNCSFSAPAEGDATTQCAFSISGDATSHLTQGSAGNYNIISNCRIFSGYYSAFVVGTSTNRATKNQFKNCDFLDFYTYAIRVEHSDSTVISQCNVERPNRVITSGFYGLYMGSGTKNTLIDRNRIHDSYAKDTTNIYNTFAIYGNAHAVAGGENVITNNIVYNIKSDGQVQGIHINNYNHYRIFNNTVYIDHPGSNATALCYGIQSRGATNNDIRNNNIYINRGGSGNKYCLYYANAKISNYNNLYINLAQPASNIGYFGTGYATLAAFSAASNTDVNSMTHNPGFVSPNTGYLMPTSLLLDNMAVPVTAVTVDYTGAVRNATTPDIGAYEFVGNTVTISGNPFVCAGATTALTGSPAGGTFSTSNASIAAVNATTGLVNALATGTANITYTLGALSYTLAVTVNPLPATPATITGDTSLCTGNITFLSNATAGGVWTSSAPLTASINTIGNVAGNLAGTSVITYTVTNNLGCSASVSKIANVVDAPIVSSIVGATNVCSSDTTIFSNTTANGVWSSSNPAVADVTASGEVLGITSGTATISYTVSNIGGCSTVVTKDIIVDQTPSLPIISGDTTLCVGSTSVLSSTVIGGVWSIDNATMATINTTGSITALSPGTGIVTYLVTNAGCSASGQVNVSVNPLPVPVITNTNNVLSTGTFATYQWYRNTVLIPGATANTYTATENGSYTVKVTNEHDCEATSALVEVTGVVGVNNMALLNKISIYPNPAKDAIYLNVPNSIASAKVDIVNLQGKVVLTQQMLNAATPVEIKLNALNAGVYFLKMNTSEGNKTFKITKY